MFVKYYTINKISRQQISSSFIDILQALYHQILVSKLFLYKYSIFLISSHLILTCFLNSYMLSMATSTMFLLDERFYMSSHSFHMSNPYMEYIFTVNT